MTQNPFILSAEQRLACWKHMREQISLNPDVHEKIDLALTWWKIAPLQNRVLDWDQPQTWPTPWHMIYQNEYCTSAHSLGIAHTLLLADPEIFSNLRLQLIWDQAASIQKIVVHTHGYYLNWGHVDKTAQHLLQHMIIQDAWEWHNKQWMSTRPK